MWDVKILTSKGGVKISFGTQVLFTLKPILFSQFIIITVDRLLLQRTAPFS